MKAARFIYGGCVLFAFLLTLIALFTPGWRSYKGAGAPDQGIVTYTCGSGNRKVMAYDCVKWATSRQGFEKATLALVIIALVLQAIAVGCFFGMFSARVRLGLPATTVVLAAFICLLIAVIVYGTGIYSKVAYMYSVTYELLADVMLGYSYWITVIATIFLFFASVSGVGLFGEPEPVR